MKRCAALLLYPVRESNASLILRRDSFYPSELTRLFSDEKKRQFIKQKGQNGQHPDIISGIRKSWEPFQSSNFRWR